MTKQGNLNVGGQTVIPNTTTAAVADVARSQALSASLAALAEKNVLGYPTFSEAEGYEAGATVFYNRRLYTFKTDHSAGAWNASEVDEADIKSLITEYVKKAIEAGTITPAKAGNLTNWDERTDLSIEDTFTDVVRTTAGDSSIKSEAGAQLVSIKPVTDFTATALVTTGFNLLRRATAVGNGWYFLVPRLPFGTYGTAEQPNGILFTDEQGNALTPTVRFKPLSQGVPTSTSQGSVCAYTDSHGMRFYTTSEPGYIIVTGITRSSTCAHIGWSRRYNEYISIDNVNDAGGSVPLTSIINAVHDFGQLLVATRGSDTVYDEITFGGTSATWRRRVGRVKPTWTTIANDSGDATQITYTHTTTIADMKAGGIAECGGIGLEVNANAIAYTDMNEAATTDYVKYELATVATGTVAVSSAMTIEDWGLEMLTGVTGQAEITMQYAQGYPDAVANLVNGGYQRRTEELEAQIAALKDLVDDIGAAAEGYIRVAGSSNPALNYAHYSYGKPGGFSRDSVFSLLYPCLIGTPLTGTGTEGKILHVLKKLGARKATAADTGFTEGQAVWEDLDGAPHAIDGTEGDVLITNIEEYHRIKGRHTIEGIEYDVFLVSRNAFNWQGIESEEVGKGGVSPDYCVSHTDSDSVIRMHSVFNPEWEGSYNAPTGIVGAYVFSQAANGTITEEYDEDATLLGGAGGLHTTDIALYTGEQRAMNNNADTTKTVPWMNATAASVENWFALMLAEGGTFDAHKASLMGSGFCGNDAATAASDWEESASGAKNGIRVEDKDGVMRMYSPATNAKAWTGGTTDFYLGASINGYRNPWHIMEAHRALCHAIANGIGELQWFVMDGVKYKWRSIDGFAGPAEGEMTAVVWKMVSGKMTDRFVDQTDKETSLEGHRIDFLFSTALYHGITTQVSPSWWTSGLIFTEDEDGNYKAYVQRDQAKLIISPSSEIAADASYAFETLYNYVADYANGSGYARNYSNEALMLPDNDANKTGAALHTYVGKYNYFSGTKAAEGKKVVRGFRRGIYVTYTTLSPLFVLANLAPSNAGASGAFGTCCQIVDEA